ncbi:MAG: histidinol dehydrogenase [Nitrospinae bacterium]|nr:histidinol dehydrogenase [Nitrospinota bacterium]
MKITKSSDPKFRETLAHIVNRSAEGPAGVEKTVAAIIKNVRAKGDDAVFKYTKKFDGVSLTPKTVRVTEKQIAAAMRSASPKVLAALKKASARIARFHKFQREGSWKVSDGGAVLGQIVRPLDSVGVYVPGGKAAYPSSVLMNVIPARIAGVRRVVMVTPAPGGAIDPHVLAAASIAGVDEIYRIGGAQAVAALSYGTKTIARVDKITGPGNAYVAEAKRQVFGVVDIDMVAGPSELLVIADGAANPAHAAADLLSQAEHDENAWPILVTTSAAIANRVAKELVRQTRILPRSGIIEKCLSANCHAFVARNLDECFEISNAIAPEHLELLIKDAARYVNRVENAGAVFVGPWTPEALGDYMAGPNHVLPTGGSARFFSPLGVYDFMKRTSLIAFTQAGFRKLAAGVMTLANEERLTAHGAAVAIRLKK